MTSYDDPLYWGTPIRFRQDFRPIGTPIRVESNNEAVVRVAQENFGRYGRPQQSESPLFTLRVCVDPVHRDGRPWPKPIFRASGHLVHISCGEANFAVADLSTGRCIGFVTSEMVKDSSFFKSAFLDCLFYVLAVHYHHTPVHCSGVVSGGRGILICGASGAGKTMLAYACMRSGMQVLSDDVVHLQIDPTTNDLRLWGKPWFLRLLPEAAVIFPELRCHQPHLRSDHEWYLEIDVERQFPGRTVVSCQPEALVFLERQNAGHTQLQPLDSSAVINRLRRDIFLSESAILQRHEATLQRLLETTKAYTLSYSGGPNNAVGVIQNILQA